MPVPKEVHERGEKLCDELEALAMKEKEPALRTASLFWACYRLAIRDGMTPAGFIDFCTKTVGAYALMDAPVHDGFPDVEKEERG